MKKAIFLLLALFSALSSQAKNDIVYHFKGDLPDDDGFIEITAARRLSDHLLIGQIYWSGTPYDIAGWEDPTDTDRIGFMIFRSGYLEGSVMAKIDSSGDLNGRITFGSFSSTMQLKSSEADPYYPDQFVTQTINDMKRFTLYSATQTKVLDEGEQSPTTSIVLEKDHEGFAFKCVGGGCDGLGSLDVLEDGTSIRESYEYNSVYFTYDNAPHYLEFEIFMDLLVVHYSNEEGDGDSSRYARADGIYSLKTSTDEFDPYYFNPEFYGFYADGDGVNDDESDYVTGEAAWGIGMDYEDVAELSLMINNGQIKSKKFPVSLEGAAKTNIDVYFRALAEVFKDYKGLFKDALPLAKPDLKNGYLSVSVPGKVGGEGLEMCFWRGAEGKDIVALLMRHDEFDVNEEWEDRVDWILVFFQYDPSEKALEYIIRWTRYGSDYSEDARYYAQRELGYIEDVRLPQVGKTIEFLDGLGKKALSCEWDAQRQWFLWKD